MSCKKFNGVNVVKAFTLLLAAFILSDCSADRVTIGHLTVEYTATPLGIDVQQPRFGWQMLAPPEERGYAQTAYRIVVNDPAGEVVWDSEKRPGPEALSIPYEGQALQASTRYHWTVTVWDQEQQEHTEGSWSQTVTVQ